MGANHRGGLLTVLPSESGNETINIDNTALNLSSPLKLLNKKFDIFSKITGTF